MLDLEEKYPSICYSCDNARKPAAEANRDKGYVGCSLRVMRKYGHPDYDEYDEGYDYHEIGEAKEVAEGWVDLRTRIFGEKSGIIANFQLLTLEVRSCRKFTQREDDPTLAIRITH